MNHTELIDALGGVTAVANALKVQTNVVGNWRQREVPWRWRHTVAKLAKRKNIDLPDEFLVPQLAERGAA